jgi:hypothetical protein
LKGIYFCIGLAQMSKNRFASLYLDDEDESMQPPPVVSVIPHPVPEQKPAFVASRPRTWSKDEGTPETKRDWNLEEKRKYRQPFSRGYAFQDDAVSKFTPLKSYAFQDEPATEEDSVRPNTPVEEKRPQLIVCRRCGGEHWTLGCSAKQSVRKTSSLNLSPKIAPTQKLDVQSQEEFPKLSDYQRPQTPPYPPDDGDYPTLAERMKRSIEKELQAEAEARFKPIDPMETFEMTSVIPMRTNLSGKFTLS